MRPLTFEPIIKRIRWGGTRLGSLLGKPIGGANDAAESWEIADQPDDRSRILNGPHTGQTLRDVIENDPAQVFGEQDFDQFPLLIKFLDANDRLSVQVHPNDDQAVDYLEGGRGKTEAWVILAAEQGACVYAGLKDGVDADSLRAALADGTVEACLHKIEVQVGDTIFIPAGTVHAIAEGIVLAEVQQQSDLTFRLYDWGRLGADGKPRQIHIEESVAVTDFQRGPISPATPTLLQENSGHRIEQLVECDYFHINRHLLPSGSRQLAKRQAFYVLMVLAGSGRWRSGDESGTLSVGQTILVPANSGDLNVDVDDDLVLLDASVPDAHT